MMLTNFEKVLEEAAADGRKVLPDATDDEARLIEAFATHLHTALDQDLDNEHYAAAERAEWAER